MPSIDKFFKDAEETLRLRFRGWEADLSHEGEKGGLRERRVRDLLVSFLPGRYGVGTGHIVDREGNLSNQTDIVIYDAIDGIVLPVDNYYSLYPCECVYAAVEVKSTLTASRNSEGIGQGTISQCVEGTRKLRALKRGSDHLLPPLLSFVFAYDTNWNDSARRVITWFSELGKEYSMGFPEMVYVLNPGYAFHVTGPSGRSRDEMLEILLIEHAPLLAFLSHLLKLLCDQKVSAPDLWYEYIDWPDVIAKGVDLSALGR